MEAYLLWKKSLETGEDYDPYENIAVDKRKDFYHKYSEKAKGEGIIHDFPKQAPTYDQTGWDAAKQLGSSADEAFGGWGKGFKDTTEGMTDAFVSFKDESKEAGGELWQATADGFEFILNAGSRTSKKLAKLQKNLAIANAIRNTAAGVIKTISVLGATPHGLAMAALVTAMGAAQLKIIQGTPIQGQAHSGLDSVDREGTYLLDKGERVVKRDQNRDLTDFLADQQRGGGSITINVSAVDVDSFKRLLQGQQKQIGGMVQNFVRENVGRKM